jgi:UDP:flavonoid glycosyltransferase YjiC (YdhE family)
MALGAEGAELTDDLPGDPIVVGLAPQLELLKRASLAITHAGLNTALEALMFGVPLVALPVANDQPGVAARLRHHGVGELIPIRHLDAPRLRNAIVHVLGDPSYRVKAQALQKELAGFDGVRRAADIIEAQFA